MDKYIVVSHSEGEYDDYREIIDAILIVDSEATTGDVDSYILKTGQNLIWTSVSDVRTLKMMPVMALVRIE